jgi:hypothetical protein
LGDLDESKWETDGNGKRRDPLQFSNYLVLAHADRDSELYTFATSSRGGLGAIGELCKSYGKQMRQQPDKYPIVELDAGSYQHRERSFGRIEYPIFNVIGWTDKTPFVELLNNNDTTTKLAPPQNEDPPF